MESKLVYCWDMGASELSLERELDGCHPFGQCVSDPYTKSFSIYNPSISPYLLGSVRSLSDIANEYLPVGCFTALFCCLADRVIMSAASLIMSLYTFLPL